MATLPFLNVLDVVVVLIVAGKNRLESTSVVFQMLIFFFFFFLLEQFFNISLNFIIYNVVIIYLTFFCLQ